MGLSAQVIFIDASYIKAYSHIDGSVDEKDMLPSIIQAQDSQIQPVLGTKLYKSLKTKISDGTIDDSPWVNYATLLNDYVRMTTLKWFLVHFYPYLQGKIMNGTIGSRNVDNITALSQSEVARLVDMERTNAQFYTERLIAYLTNNTQSFILDYNKNTGADMTPETQTYSEAGLTISGTNRVNKLQNWNCCL